MIIVMLKMLVTIMAVVVVMIIAHWLGPILYGDGRKRDRSIVARSGRLRSPFIMGLLVGLMVTAALGCQQSPPITTEKNYNPVITFVPGEYKLELTINGDADETIAGGGQPSTNEGSRTISLIDLRAIWHTELSGQTGEVTQTTETSAEMSGGLAP